MGKKLRGAFPPKAAEQQIASSRGNGALDENTLRSARERVEEKTCVVVKKKQMNPPRRTPLWVHLMLLLGGIVFVHILLILIFASYLMSR